MDYQWSVVLLKNVALIYILYQVTHDMLNVYKVWHI